MFGAFGGVWGDTAFDSLFAWRLCQQALATGKSYRLELKIFFDTLLLGLDLAHSLLQLHDLLDRGQLFIALVSWLCTAEFAPAWPEFSFLIAGPAELPRFGCVLKTAVTAVITAPSLSTSKLTASACSAVSLELKIDKLIDGTKKYKHQSYRRTDDYGLT